MSAPRSTTFYTLSLHDALPISQVAVVGERLLHQPVEDGVLEQLPPLVGGGDRGLRHAERLRQLGIRPDVVGPDGDRKSTRLNSSHGYISYAVFCLKKKNRTQRH